MVDNQKGATSGSRSGVETDFFLRTDHFKVHTNKKIIKAHEYQVICKAQEIISNAEHQARKIIDSAKETALQEKARAKQIIDEAVSAFEKEKQKGYVAGFDEGKAEMAKKLTEIVADTSEYIHSIEEDIVNTVISAINKILGEIGDDDVIGHLVVKTLKSVRDQKHLKLRVSPEQIDIVKEKVDSIRDEIGDVGFIEIEAEDRIGIGGCILETKMGVVDASLDVQLQAIRNALKNRLMKNKPKEP